MMKYDVTEEEMVYCTVHSTLYTVQNILCMYYVSQIKKGLGMHRIIQPP